MSDSYFSIEKRSEGLYRSKGSKFIAVATPVASEEEINEVLSGLRKEYYDARHHCYAWRLGKEGKHARANDDGEPSHSAGTPILNELRSRDLTFTLVTVIRYFGGTKLGVPGLIEAYRSATADALDNNLIQEVIVYRTLRIRFSYQQTSEVNRVLHKLDLKPAKTQFLEDCQFDLNIRESEFEEVASMFEKLSIFNEELVANN